jgi:hypothetical protein
MHSECLSDDFSERAVRFNSAQVKKATLAFQGAEQANSARGIKFVGDTFLNPNPNGGGFFATLPRVQSADVKELMIRGKGVYEELCYQCHGDDGRGTPVDGRPGFTRLTARLTPSRWCRMAGTRMCGSPQWPAMFATASGTAQVCNGG